MKINKKLAIFAIIISCFTLTIIKKSYAIEENNLSAINIEEYYTYEKNSDGENTYTITGYKGEFYTNILPNTYNGNPITRVGKSAFKDNKLISGNISIPDNIAIIEDEAFQNCTLISSVKLPEKTRSIGNLAFKGCESIEEINLDNVKYIGNEAFMDCKNNKEKMKPLILNKVNFIGSNVFNNCNTNSIEFTSSTAPSVLDNTFEGFNGIVYIPKENEQYHGTAWSGSIVKGVKLLGDLDRNGVVDSNDASYALNIYKTGNATKDNLDVGDIDRNGIIDSNDASEILRIYKTKE